MPYRLIARIHLRVLWRQCINLCREGLWQRIIIPGDHLLFGGRLFIGVPATLFRGILITLGEAQQMISLNNAIVVVNTGSDTAREWDSMGGFSLEAKNFFQDSDFSTAHLRF